VGELLGLVETVNMVAVWGSGEAVLLLLLLECWLEGWPFAQACS
jgi:hypothetical protein